MRQIACGATVALLVLVSGCGPKNDHTGPANPPAMSQAPSAATSAPPRRIIDFGQEGVEVQKAADATRLTGTSDEFKSFVVNLATHLERPPGATDCAIGITVLKYDPAGFAVGGVNDCGGYAALWGRKDGAWKELIGTQDAWLCSDLKKYGVPAHGVVRTCIGGSKPSEMKEVPYTG